MLFTSVCTLFVAAAGSIPLVKSNDQPGRPSTCRGVHLIDESLSVTFMSPRAAYNRFSLSSTLMTFKVYRDAEKAAALVRGLLWFDCGLKITIDKW